MKDHPLGHNAAIIGQVTQDENGFLDLKTNFGGNRILEWLAGEHLSRIC